MRSMTIYNRGDIILVNFWFSEGAGSKIRPALILTNNIYNKDRQEVIVAAITSNTKRILPGDIKIENWKEAGLLLPSHI